MFADKQAEGAQRVRDALTPALVPGEQLAGAIHATRKSAFSGKVFAVGATDQRLVMVELDRKFAAKGSPISVRASEITKSSIDGSGGGLSHQIASITSGSIPEIRFDTANEKYKFSVMGGLTGETLMGADYMAGLEAVCEFIWAATH